MAKPGSKIVKTIVDFVKETDRLLGTTETRQTGIPGVQNWYRGIGKISFELKPSVFRVSRNTAIEYLNLEGQMLMEFERQVLIQGDAAPGSAEEQLLLKLFHMQHYGVPTRLLDWTTNPLIALYFALASEPESKENPAVWVLDPWAWNETILIDKTWEKKGPASAFDLSISGYMPRRTFDQIALESAGVNPIAIIGTYNTDRMRAQRGVFTLFGKGTKCMAEVHHDAHLKTGTLYKIEIDRAEVPKMFRRLIAIGVTDSVSYPDFQGVAMEIRRAHGYKV